MEIDLPRAHFDRVTGTGGQVGLGPRVHRQVRLGERELALEEALVDRPELADPERPEIDRTFYSLGRPVEEERGKRRRKLPVGERQARDPGSEHRDGRIGSEKGAVVRRDVPLRVSLAHRLPDLRDLGPVEVLVTILDALLPSFLETLGNPLERVFPVAPRGVQGKQVPVLGVRDEEEPVEDAKRRLVRLLEIFLVRVLRRHRRHDSAGERRYDLAIDPVAKPASQIRGVVLTSCEDLLDGSAG